MWYKRNRRSLLTHLSHVLRVAQDVSARRVAAAVARHVQQLGWATQRDLDLEEDWQLTQDHLQHTGINADGVINQIRRRLDHVGGATMLIAFTTSRSARRSCVYTLWGTGSSFLKVVLGTC